jgi:hypothetical protein
VAAINSKSAAGTLHSDDRKTPFGFFTDASVRDQIRARRTVVV